MVSPVPYRYLTCSRGVPTLEAIATLPDNISSLTDAEKFELLDAIWLDLEARAFNLGLEQAKELDLRIEGYEKSPPGGASWDLVEIGLPQR